ncbi:MAG: 23S rRNA (uracil(1939)-C(5))-methyltransferase RlmD [Clostridiales bacterium]|nr:23S rRNA (uracil(1939)-C(5))-methyltransferase RlmD [Clostridiales bacterium]
MSAPFKKNDDITLEITGMSSEGSGVGRYEGFAVFVPFTLPGETVSAHIIKVTGSYAVGKLMEVIVPSPERVDPPCPVFKKCGGCTLMHMSYQAQLEYKRNAVRDALVRLGGFKDIEVKPVIGMDEPARYRNKGSFPFGNTDIGVTFGLYAQRSHRLVPTSDCIIERETAIRAAEAAADWASANGIPAYDEVTKRGVIRHVVTRSCTGGAAVCVVTTGKLPHKDDLIERIKKAVPEVRSIVHNVNPDDTNAICGKEDRLIYGSETVVQNMGGLDFEVSRESFLQVNPVQTEKLYSLAIEGLELKGNETVADVFCGIGTITLMLAKRAKSAVGIEYVEKAVDDAKRNAELNGIANADFICGAAETALPELIGKGRRFDAVTLDPPRKGADPEVLKAIAECGAEKIAYVSCSPATLARDLKLLAGYGFRIVSVQPVDMFPMTSHVETVVTLFQTNRQSEV